MAVNMKLQFRRDTKENWTTNVGTKVMFGLAQGEIGVEKDTFSYKIGDGIQSWAALPYSGGLYVPANPSHWRTGTNGTVPSTIQQGLNLVNGFLNSNNLYLPAYTNLAGNNKINSQTSDGTGTSALFNTITGITLDAANNIYVIERSTGKIRKITPKGVVTTINPSMNLGINESVNGLEIDSSGKFYTLLNTIFTVSNQSYNARSILTLGTNNTFTTFAGGVGTGLSNIGTNDGIGTNARFYFLLNTLRFNPSKTDLYLIDTNYDTNNPSSFTAYTFRKIHIDGTVTSLFTFNRTIIPNDLYDFVVDASNNIYISNANRSPNNAIVKIGTNGTFTDIKRAGNTIFNPKYLAFDVNYTLYYSDSNLQNINKIGTDGSVKIVAGGNKTNNNLYGLGTNSNIAIGQYFCINNLPGTSSIIYTNNFNSVNKLTHLNYV